MAELKLITQDSIPRAFEKAERYRLLNEPFLAESICLDILAIRENHNDARVCLVLALADQVAQSVPGTERRAHEEAQRLGTEYERYYYAGIVCERHASALIRGNAPGSRDAAYHCISEAMRQYERADDLSPPGNEDATLRWNTCLRLIRRHSLVAPSEDRHEYPIE